MTGATGFIGTHIVRALATASHDVSALVRDSTRAAHLRCAEARPFDLFAPNDVDLTGFDALVHAAAYKPKNFEDANEAGRCLEANALATLSLARRAAAAGVSCFIYISAGNAYADTSRVAQENDALFPSARAAYYLVSKVCGEVYADAVAIRFPAMRVASLRAAAVYGPGMDARSLVPTVIQRLHKNEPVEVKAGGAQQADYVYVGDVAAATVSALARAARGPINIGSGRATTTLEVVREIVDIMGASPNLLRIETAPSEPPPGFPALNIERAQNLLDYRPTSLREGLSSCVSTTLGGHE